MMKITSSTNITSTSGTTLISASGACRELAFMLPNAIIYPPWIEVLRGNAYFDVTSNDVERLEVRVGTVRIKDIGTRFSVRMQQEGGSVAVADGQVEIHLETGIHLVSAREHADFDSARVTKHRVTTEADVAPWRVN